MKYVAFVTPKMSRRIDAVLGDPKSVRYVDSVTALLAEMRGPAITCVIVDPSLLSRAAAAAIVEQSTIVPQPIVAYAAMVREAFEASILLAQGTAADFVFEGMPDEASVLRRALLLAPDAGLGRAVNNALRDRFDLLPRQLRIVVRSMLETGTAPKNAEALAEQAGLARRSMDRAFETAGLESIRYFIAAAHLIRAYRAVAWSRIPFRRIAAMAGYASQRSLDQQFSIFLETSSKAIREDPPALENVVARIAARLASRPGAAEVPASQRGSATTHAAGFVSSHVWTNG